MTFQGMIDRLEEANFGSIYAIAIERTESQFLDQQRAQMEDGKRKDQSSMTPLYSDAYKSQKKRLGLETEHITLYKTGDFYADLFIDVNSTFATKAGTYTIDSANRVSEYLEMRYKAGSSIYGLGGPYRIVYLEALRNELKKTLSERI